MKPNGKPNVHARSAAFFDAFDAQKDDRNSVPTGMTAVKDRQLSGASGESADREAAGRCDGTRLPSPCRNSPERAGSDSGAAGIEQSNGMQRAQYEDLPSVESPQRSKASAALSANVNEGSGACPTSQPALPARSGSSKRKRKERDANAEQNSRRGLDRARQVTAPSDCTSGERRELANPPDRDVTWRVTPRVENDDDWQGPVLVSARTAWAAWQKAQSEHDVRLPFSGVVCSIVGVRE